MVLLLLDTGVRASELCSLTLDNVALNEGYMKVTGKRSKERMLPFGTITKKALIRYISTWRLEPESDSVDEVILSVAGTPLTYAGLSKAIKRLGKRAGVPRLHAHLFRHTFAVRYLMNGGDVMTLRLILGHTTLDVTLPFMPQRQRRSLAPRCIRLNADHVVLLLLECTHHSTRVPRGSGVA
ncbi:unnamed protein product [marine sediment metagenome]|uniref:Tyr recombinase domain-containing protein n=1 Tax=marine sediment metagenome TaxID=412755 RepID=X0SM81_9ZZZZ